MTYEMVQRTFGRLRMDLRVARRLSGCCDRGESDLTCSVRIARTRDGLAEAVGRSFDDSDPDRIVGAGTVAAYAYEDVGRTWAVIAATATEAEVEAELRSDLMAGNPLDRRMRTFAGHSFTLTAGRRYLASRPAANQDTDRFVVTIRDVTDGPDGPVVAQTNPLDWDSATDLVMAFNIGTTDDTGRRSW